MIVKLYDLSIVLSWKKDLW